MTSGTLQYILGWEDGSSFQKWREERCQTWSCQSKLRYGVHIVHIVPLNSASLVRLVILTFERCENLNSTQTLMIYDVRPWRKFYLIMTLRETVLVEGANESQGALLLDVFGCYSIVSHSTRRVMNAEFAIPNCVRYIILAYLDAKGEIWLPYEKQLEQKRKPVWKYAFFQQGCRTCPLCIFQERKARKIPNYISSWAEHWSIGQSCPYCKERPFSERNPQLLSTATIATILNFILLRGLWSRSEPEQQFSDAKVSYHLKTTIFFGSKFQSLEWSLFFLDGARLKLINNPRKSNKFFGHENPNSKISRKHLCIQPFVGKIQPSAPLQVLQKRWALKVPFWSMRGNRNLSNVQRAPPP